MLISTIIQHACLLQARTSFVFLQAYSVPYEQSQANGTAVYDQPEDSGDEYDASSSSSSSSQGPPGFSSTVKGSQVIIIDHHLLLLSAGCKKLHACSGDC